MAVKAKKEVELMHNQVLEGITKAVQELYKHHSGEIQENLDESESKKVAVGFGCEIDCSESQPMVTVKIRFSASVTDKRVFRLDDSKQINLFETKEAARPEAAGDSEPGAGGEE